MLVVCDFVRRLWLVAKRVFLPSQAAMDVVSNAVHRRAFLPPSPHPNTSQQIPPYTSGYKEVPYELYRYTTILIDGVHLGGGGRVRQCSSPASSRPPINRLRARMLVVVVVFEHHTHVHDECCSVVGKRRRRRRRRRQPQRRRLRRSVLRASLLPDPCATCRFRLERPIVPAAPFSSRGGGCAVFCLVVMMLENLFFFVKNHIFFEKATCDTPVGGEEEEEE